MKAFFSPNKLIMICILGMALFGCVTQPSAPTRFYMLAPLAPSTETASVSAEERRTIIAVEPVEIPGYLDRNQIVTRSNDTEYRLAEFDQWTEPLGNTLTRVIAENLSRLLATDTVDVIPSARSVPFDYSIKIGVLRFDGKPEDQVTLIANWAIFGQDEDSLILLRKSEYRETVDADTQKPKSQFQTVEGSEPVNYKGFVTAQSRAVEKLSRDIAAAMKKTLANPSNR